jgi:chitodextrinase
MLVRQSKKQFTILTALLSILALMPATPAAAASCTIPSTDYGSVTSSVATPEAATYRIWTRMLVPDTSNNSYLLQIDNNGSQTCFNVGGSGVAVNSWVWVAFQNGSSASRTDIALSAGSHNLKMIGNKPNVKIDRLILTSDLSCTPQTIDGSDCNTPTDTTPPNVDLSAPAAGATVNGVVDVSASANDNVGVTKVEFYVDSTLQNTATASPYGFRWSTTDFVNKSYLLTAKAYDAAGNIGTDSYQVTVQNSDQQAPSVPGNVKAVAAAYNKINVSWTASSDNIAVKSYLLFRNGTPVAEVTTPSYADNTVQASTTYNYQVQAKDTAGNTSALSQSATVTTPSVADTTPPSTPQKLTAKVISSSQINLKWQASTDSIGVKSYEVYRATTGGSTVKIADVTGTTFGDSSLTPNTNYTYSVKARDAAGNVSQASNDATAKTSAPTHRGVLHGTVRNERTSRPVANALVTLSVQGKRYISTTDSSGRYVFRNLDSGRYSVTFRARDYRSKSISVKIDNDRVVRDVTLGRR